MKINSIRQFSSPGDLAQRVVEVERSKEGFMDAEVLGAASSSIPPTASEAAYDLEYKVLSTRGLNHYKVRTTILDKKLFVFTVQFKEEDFDRLHDVGDEILDSLTIQGSSNPMQ